MLRPIFLVLLLVSASAQAEVFMCKKPNGATEFSDTPCQAGSASAVVPDRDPVTRQQQLDAQRNLRERSEEAAEFAAKRAAEQDQRQLEREQTPVAENTPSPDTNADDTYDDTYDCSNDRRISSVCDKRRVYDEQDRKVVPQARPLPR